MDEFITRVHDQISAAVADREYHDIFESFTITKTDAGDVIAETTLVTEEQQPLFDTDLGKDDLPPDAGDWDSNYETLHVPLGGDLVAESEVFLSRLQDAVDSRTDVVTTYDPKLFCGDPEKGVSAILDFRLELDTIPFDFDELSVAVTDDSSSYIDNPSRITTVTVRSPLYDPEESDRNMETSPDYTVNFTTNTPHEMWADCDTLDDYAEMVADNNEDTTVADVLRRDTYYNHFHIYGDVEPNAIVSDVTQDILDKYITVDVDGLRVSAHDFGVSVRTEDEVWVSGSVAGWISDLRD